MRRPTTLLLALVLSLGVAFGVPAGARADNGGADNAAVAINLRDGSSVFRLAFAIRRVAGDVVDTTNGAVAFASCTDCQTTAIAIEVVLITDDASTITPTNVAIAYNFECDTCVTVAEAYQFVFTTGGQVHFTAEGNRELAQIRHDLEDLRNADLSVTDLQARLDEIVDRLKKVLTTQLVPAGKSGSTDTSTSTGQTEPSATQPTTTTPAETGSVTTTAPTTTDTTTTTETTTTP